MKWILLVLGVFMLNMPKALADVQFYGSIGFKIANIEKFDSEDRIQIFEYLRNRSEFNSEFSDIGNSIFISSNKPFSEVKNGTLITMFFEFHKIESLELINSFIVRIKNNPEFHIVIIRDFSYRKYEATDGGGVNPWPWTSGGN